MDLINERNTKYMKITKLVVISLKAISTLYFLLWWRSFELLSWWTVLTPL